MVLSQEPSCGLYVHAPFCETKCGYCDFFSVPLRGRSTVGLVERVCRELRNRVPHSGHRVRTVFCGGGTPTLLPLDVLEGLLNTIAEMVRVNDLEEFTVEANPATVEEAKAELLVRSGVSRVSMGAQSFFPAELATLERLHSPDDIPPSVATLRRCGVGQINLDLIFGIPGQTVATWAESLRRAIELDVDHIACYGLTYEPGTAMTARRNDGLVTACDEQLEADLYELAIDTLAEAGYLQYEISNFARPGRESKHNLVYWRNEPYIGVGPSAAGCYSSTETPKCRNAETGEGNVETSKRQNVETEEATEPRSHEATKQNGETSKRRNVETGRILLRRYKNIADVSRYMRAIDAQGHAEAESESLDTQAVILEMILMQLRLNEGLSIESFRRRTGHDPRELFGGALGRLVDQRSLVVSDHAISLTRQGRLICNAVMTELATVLPLERSSQVA